MLQALWVGLGGFTGAICRYGVSLLTGRFYTGSLPLVTLLVNVIGAFGIGFITAGAAKSQLFSASMLPFLTVGLMGGFTTFSTFSLDSIKLLEQGKIAIAGLSICLNVFLCLTACWIGKICIK